MNSKIKVLIGSDTADCGMAWAGALKGAGMYAITRRCDGNAAQLHKVGGSGRSCA